MMYHHWIHQHLCTSNYGSMNVIYNHKPACSVHCTVAPGKWEDGVNRRDGKFITNATDWPHLVASLH